MKRLGGELGLHFSGGSYGFYFFVVNSTFAR